MSKGFSTSSISILAQLSAWRSDDDYEQTDARIPLIGAALATVELIRAERLSASADEIEVVSPEPVGDLILDGVLLWTEKGQHKPIGEFLREDGLTALERAHSSLIAQKVLFDADGPVVIRGAVQDTLRDVLRVSVLSSGYKPPYPHHSLLYALASSYSPNGHLFFSLLGMTYDSNLLGGLYGMPSPWLANNGEPEDGANFVMSALHEVTKDS